MKDRCYSAASLSCYQKIRPRKKPFVIGVNSFSIGTYWLVNVARKKWACVESLYSQSPPLAIFFLKSAKENNINNGSRVSKGHLSGRRQTE